jgi:hypothetical protein
MFGYEDTGLLGCCLLPTGKQLNDFAEECNASEAMVGNNCQSQLVLYIGWFNAVVPKLSWFTVPLMSSETVLSIYYSRRPDFSSSPL